MFHIKHAVLLSSSFIRTIPSALESHQICRSIEIDRSWADSVIELRNAEITTGGESHPALKRCKVIIVLIFKRWDSLISHVFAEFQISKTDNLNCLGVLAKSWKHAI